MADSHVYREAEEEIRAKLPEIRFFKEKNLRNFRKDKLRLSSGGEYEFDAVDEEGIAAVNISASKGLTHRGYKQAGTLRKIQAEVDFLTRVNVKYRVLIFVQETAYDVFCEQQKKGRIPKEIELLHVPVSEELQKLLAEAGQKASDEVNPNQTVE